MNLQAINDQINAHLRGLPITIVVAELRLLIAALCEKIERLGWDAEAIVTDHIRGHDQSREPEDAPDLGPCCACEKIGPTVRNIVMLDKRAVVAGHGWGCVECGLPSNGASYVLCDACLEEKREPRDACRGYPGKDGRIAIDSLTVPFEHDLAKHGEHPGAHHE